MLAKNTFAQLVDLGEEEIEIPSKKKVVENGVAKKPEILVCPFGCSDIIFDLDEHYEKKHLIHCKSCKDMFLQNSDHDFDNCGYYFCLRCHQGNNVGFEEGKRHESNCEPCPKCESIFSGRRAIQNHLWVCHQTPTDCSKCHQPIDGGYSALMQHQVEAHEKKEKNFSCHHCGKKITQSQLDSHLAEEHPKVFSCRNQDCNFQTTVHQELMKHLKNQHPKLTVCTECGKNVLKEKILEHLKEQHSKKNNRRNRK